MKKIIFSLFIFISVLFFSPYTSHASTIKLPELPTTSYDNYVIIEKSDSVLLYYTSTTMVYHLSYNQLFSSIYSDWSYSTYELIDGKWKFIATRNVGPNNVISVGSLSNIMYSSYDIYNRQDSSEVLFEKKYVPVPPVPSELEEVIVQVELEEVLAPILSLVGLVVSCLVSWMALRKSWTWLLSQLRSL